MGGRGRKQIALESDKNITFTPQGIPCSPEQGSAWTPNTFGLLPRGLGWVGSGWVGLVRLTVKHTPS